MPYCDAVETFHNVKTSSFFNILNCTTITRHFAPSPPEAQNVFGLVIQMTLHFIVHHYVASYCSRRVIALQDSLKRLKTL